MSPEDKLSTPQIGSDLFTSAQNYTQRITPPESPPPNLNSQPSNANFHQDIHHINNKSNLNEWAPADMARPPQSQRKFHNLPDWNILNRSDVRHGVSDRPPI